MSKRKVYLRADAGPQIGYGHFVRSLALADMLKSDFECILFTPVPNEFQLREADAICPIVSLPQDDSRFDNFLDYLTGDEIVVLDNYFYTTAYQHQIKEKGCTLVCINDMPLYPFYCDAIICPDPLLREDFVLEKEASLSIGLDWTLLRKPFRENCGTYNGYLSNRICICFGGADPYRLTELYTNLLLQYSKYDLDVIVGANVPFTIQNDRVHIFKGVDADQIVKIFQRARFGIFPASTICNEVLAIGLPFAVGHYMDNQQKLYQYLVNNQFGYPLGNLLTEAKQNVEKLSLVADFPIPPYKIDYISLKERFVNLFYSIGQ